MLIYVFVYDKDIKRRMALEYGRLNSIIINGLLFFLYTYGPYII